MNEYYLLYDPTRVIQRLQLLLMILATSDRLHRYFQPLAYRGRRESVQILQLLISNDNKSYESQCNSYQPYPKVVIVPRTPRKTEAIP
jgi:DNA integrity scanning protein DisA with diadenylate cyclase activity